MGTVPVPYSPVAGDDATQARVLTWADSAAYLLGSVTSGGSRRPVCVMRQTVAQSIPNTTGTAVNFDVEDVDYDNGHSTVTNTSRYTAATAGWYDVKYLIAFAFNTTGQRQAWLRLNGVTNVNSAAIQENACGAGPSEQGASRLVFLNAGDYIELIAWQNSTAALNTQAAAATDASMMSVEWRSN